MGLSWYPLAKSQVSDSQSGDSVVGIRVFGDEITYTSRIFSSFIMVIWSLDLAVNAPGLLPTLPE
jgi:hypothetical protein